jgi:peptide/nickel transport system substrate-binding protein
VTGDEATVRGRLGDRADLSLDTPPEANTTPGRGRIQTAPSGCLRYLWMNTRVAPFTDGGLRRDVARAIDREGVLAALGGPGIGQPTAWPLVRTLVGAEAAPSPRPAPPPAQPRRGAAVLTVGDRARDVAEARAIASSLATVGITVRVRPVPIATLYVDEYEVPSRRIQMGVATWCADWPGLGGRAHLTPLLGSARFPARGNQNYAMVAHAGLQRLLDTASRAPADQASARWTAAAAEVVRLGVWVPLVDLNEVSHVSERLAGTVATAAFPRGDLAGLWLRR